MITSINTWKKIYENPYVDGWWVDPEASVPSEPISISTTSVNHVDYNYGRNHLAQQGMNLGDLIMEVDEMRIGTVYCIVDIDLNEWNSGYRLTRIVGDVYLFTNELSHNSEVETFTKNELRDLINDDAIAYQE